MITRFRLIFTALGVSLYFLFLIASTPASWFAWVLVDYKSPIRILNAQGSFWDGRGELSILLPTKNILRLGPIHWEIQPLGLIIGRIFLQARSTDSGPIKLLDITASSGKLTFKRINISFDLEKISTVVPMLALTNPSGNVEILTQNFIVGAKELSGKAEIRAKELKSTLTGPEPLGNYLIKIEAKKRQLNYTIETLSGILPISGNGRWDVLGSGVLEFHGTVVPPASNPGLHAFIGSLGRDIGGSKIQINWRGRIF